MLLPLLNLVQAADPTTSAEPRSSAYTEGAEFDGGTFGVCLPYGANPVQYYAGYVIVSTANIDSATRDVERWYLPVGWDNAYSDTTTWTFYFLDKAMPYTSRPRGTWTYIRVASGYPDPAASVAIGDPESAWGNPETGLDKRFPYGRYQILQGDTVNATVYSGSGNENWQMTSGWIRPTDQDGPVTWTVKHYGGVAGNHKVNIDSPTDVMWGRAVSPPLTGDQVDPPVVPCGT